MNGLAERLGISFPLIQAGMGGVAGPELAAAVASVGAGGVVALYRMTPAMIERTCSEVQSRTSRIYGVNLIPELVGVDRLAEQIEAVLQYSDRRVFFTFFGLPDQESAQRLLRAGHPFVVMVGSVEEAIQAEALGSTAIGLQGHEAGGHLLGDTAVADLIHAVKSSGVRSQVVAAGGIGSGRAFRALNAIGASGCICGTIFVATTESRAHSRYKSLLISASPTDTVVTSAYEIGWPGRPHRVLANELTRLWPKRKPKNFIARLEILGATHPLPRYSAMVPTDLTYGLIEEMAMYCGLSVGQVRAIEAARVVVERFIGEFYADQDGCRPARSF